MAEECSAVREFCFGSGAWHCVPSLNQSIDTSAGKTFMMVLLCHSSEYGWF